jgi:hypothetical protein
LYQRRIALIIGVIISTATEKDLTCANKVLSSFTYSNCGDHEIKYFIALSTGHGFTDEQIKTVAYNQAWEFFKKLN